MKKEVGKNWKIYVAPTLVGLPVALFFLQVIDFEDMMIVLGIAFALAVPYLFFMTAE